MSRSSTALAIAESQALSDVDKCVEESSTRFHSLDLGVIHVEKLFVSLNNYMEILTKQGFGRLEILQKVKESSFDHLDPQVKQFLLRDFVPQKYASDRNPWAELVKPVQISLPKMPENWPKMLPRIDGRIGDALKLVEDIRYMDADDVDDVMGLIEPFDELYSEILVIDYEPSERDIIELEGSAYLLKYARDNNQVTQSNGDYDINNANLVDFMFSSDIICLNVIYRIDDILKNAKKYFGKINRSGSFTGSIVLDDNERERLLAAADAKEVGAMFERAREGAGLNKKQAERASGIQTANIRKLENGVHSPSLERMQQYAEALGFDVQIQLLPKDKS